MRAKKMLTRRELLRWSAGSLLAAGLWPGRLRSEGAADSSDFCFIAVNDMHYLDQRCGPWLEGAVRQMKAHPEKIEFCLLAGDLAENGRAEQLAPVRDLLKGLQKPTYVVVGNHDYLTQDDRNPYEELFPERINYHFEHRGWRFMGLDSSEGQKAKATSVQTATLQWLDETLPKLDKKQPTVLFTHFPMGPLVPARPKNAEEVLARFKEYNLQAVYCGHFHGFTERQRGKTVFTTNRCCSFSRQNHDGTKEKGYFLCHVKDGTIQRRFVEVKPA
jgi:predicted MPP superfamily phosphohydrolase